VSRSVNRVTLVGNVGSDADVRTTNSGTKYAKLSLATSTTFKDRSGQQQEKVQWHRLTVWDKLADVVEQYVHKGDRLYVEGRIEYSQSEDRDGQKRHWTDIVVTDLVMLGGAQGGQRAPQASQQQPSSPFDADDDDLPFD
jgi:single-strand DNA-binding protein